MNRRFFLAGSVAAASGAVLLVEGCGGKNAFTRGGGDLAQYTLNVGYTDSTIGGYRMRTRTYNGSTLGPTLETTPGATLSIRVQNQLPPNPKAVVPSGQVRIPAVSSMIEAMEKGPKPTRDATVIDPMNNPHDFNTTNLHVHGIQTIPHLFDPIGTTNPSAMMLNIEPGSGLTYDFPIPGDHPSGLFWFHPHHHGSTDVQVSGGMAGLIVVRGAIDKVPEIAKARELFMVIQTLNVNPSADDPSLYVYEPIAYQTPQNGGYNLGTDYTMLAVNGTGVNWANNQNNTYQQLPVPQFTAQPGEVVRLRLLNGTNFLFLPLIFPGLEVYQIAFDGVNFDAPAAGTYDYTGTVSAANMFTANVMMTSPANRMELLVRMPQTPGTYTISSAPTSDVAFMPFPKFDLAQFVVAGPAVQMSIPTALPVPEREYPIIADGEIVAHRTVTYSEGPDSTLLTGFGFYIDGKLYDEMATPVVSKSGTAEEWTIVNKTSESHPFHIHVNSFQLFKVNGQSVGTPQVWDTFLVPPSANGVDGSITIRIRFKEFIGKTVHHCHVLPHEDTGMMQNLLIT